MNVDVFVAVPPEFRGFRRFSRKTPAYGEFSQTAGTLQVR